MIFLLIESMQENDEDKKKREARDKKKTKKNQKNQKKQQSRVRRCWRSATIVSVPSRGQTNRYDMTLKISRAFPN